MKNRFLLVAGWLGWCLAAAACAQKSGGPNQAEGKTVKMSGPELALNENQNQGGQKMEIATFGAGCFWCVEAVFQRVDGVGKVVSGYAGGHVANPTYEQVCDKTTGHVEVCQISYDPAKVSYAELLEVFFKTHDPTTLNRQGNDEGPQYRSAIFYHSAEQKALAEKAKTELGAAGIWPGPIVTEVVPMDKFYPAEDYHQNYYNQNASRNPYCSFVITPKLDKFKKVFKEKLKKEGE
jgi:peptide-methionine (S)-S-oxide reductase